MESHKEGSVYGRILYEPGFLMILQVVKRIVNVRFTRREQGRFVLRIEEKRNRKNMEHMEANQRLLESAGKRLFSCSRGRTEAEQRLVCDGKSIFQE